MNTLTDIRARIAQVRAWDHDDAHPETLEKINALADDTAALADLVESRNAFSLTPGSILVLRDTWSLYDVNDTARIHIARLEKTLKRWKVGLLVLPPDPADAVIDAATQTGATS